MRTWEDNAIEKDRRAIKNAFNSKYIEYDSGVAQWEWGKVIGVY